MRSTRTPHYRRSGSKAMACMLASIVHGCGSRHWVEMGLYKAISDQCNFAESRNGTAAHRNPEASIPDVEGHPIGASAVTSKNDGDEQCRVALADVTDFAWDRVAFVADLTPSIEVEAALGVSGLGMPNMEDWIIFVDRGKVVHIERKRLDADRIPEYVVFVDYDALPKRAPQRWLIYQRDEAVFDVMRDGPHDTSLVLRPIITSSSTDSK